MKTIQWIVRRAKANQGACIMLLLLALVAMGVSTRVFARILAPINVYNDAFLEKSIKDSATLMIPVGIAKGAADVVEGSTFEFGAGVVVANASTTLEIGDSLQPLLDYLDIAWRILIVSIIVSTLSKYILLGSGPITQIMLTISLSGFLISFVLRNFVKPENICLFATTRVAKMTLLVALVFLLVLPFTIYFAAHITVATTAPLEKSLFQSFKEAGDHFNMDAFYAADGLKEKAKALYDKSLDLMKYALTATKDIAISVAKLFVIKLLNGVVFPLGALAFLIWLVRGVLYPVMGLSGTGLASNDFRNIGSLLTARKNLRENMKTVELADAND